MCLFVSFDCFSPHIICSVIRSMCKNMHFVFWFPQSCTVNPTHSTTTLMLTRKKKKHYNFACRLVHLFHPLHPCSAVYAEFVMASLWCLVCRKSCSCFRMLYRQFFNAYDLCSPHSSQHGEVIEFRKLGAKGINKQVLPPPHATVLNVDPWEYRRSSPKRRRWIDPWENRHFPWLRLTSINCYWNFFLIAHVSVSLFHLSTAINCYWNCIPPSRNEFIHISFMFSIFPLPITIVIPSHPLAILVLLILFLFSTIINYHSNSSSSCFVSSFHRHQLPLKLHPPF